jgi:hypothetical protein
MFPNLRKYSFSHMFCVTPLGRRTVFLPSANYAKVLEITFGLPHPPQTFLKLDASYDTFDGQCGDRKACYHIATSRHINLQPLPKEWI